MNDDGQQVSVDTGEGTAQTPPASPDTSEGAGSVELTPQIQALIDTATSKVKAEYEDAGGTIPKIQSSYDIKIRELKQQLQQQQTRKLEEAAELLETDPSRAKRMYEEYAQSQQHQQQADSVRDGWQEWIGQRYTARGFDLNDPEVAKKAAGDADRLLARAASDPDQGASAAIEWQATFDGEVIEAKDKELVAVGKKFEDLEKSIEGQIDAAVQRYLSGSGESRPDLGVPGRPSGGKTDYSQQSSSKNIQEGLAARRKTAQQK